LSYQHQTWHYGSRLACIDPEVKRSKVKVTRLWKSSWLHGC